MISFYICLGLSEAVIVHLVATYLFLPIWVLLQLLCLFRQNSVSFPPFCCYLAVLPHTLFFIILIFIFASNVLF